MIKIKQATKKGYIEVVDGGVVDCYYPESETRRGRVVDHGRICPTILSSTMELYVITEVNDENISRND